MTPSLKITSSIKGNKNLPYSQFLCSFVPLFRNYMRQIYLKTIESGKLQFLKNWNICGKCHIQNIGKHTIAKLQVSACNILNKSDNNYTSHTWRRSEATNLADAGVSLINLKRHGQWFSDSIVEGYIANSQLLLQERLRFLLHEVEQKMLERRGKVG